MSVEAGATISNFDESWPRDDDPILEGDDHIRLIKAILKTQFPGSGGLGFSVPISATEAEINFLSGVTSNIQDQLDAITSDDSLMAPTGTTMVFYQSAPPTGWVQNSSFNNNMLVIVNNATGGTSAGSDDPTNPNLSHTHTTGDHTLTSAQMPAHAHSAPGGGVFVQTGGTGGSVNNFDNNNSGVNKSNAATTIAGSGQAHNHGATGSSGSNIFNPRYSKMCMAVKT